MSSHRFPLAFAARVLLSGLAVFASQLYPANAAATGESPVLTSGITAEDRSAAAHVGSFTVHVLAANTVQGALAAARRRLPTDYQVQTTHGFYPADLTYFGGPVLKTVVQHNVYVNAADGATWGFPARFEEDLSESRYIHLTDQYVGTTANDRYTVGKPLSIKLPIYAPLYDQDILTLAHAAAKKLGVSGLQHIVHLFFGPGVDICSSGGTTTQCYSPDNPATFYFCAYHESINFSDLGLVLISVEPYQPVSGCGVDFGGVKPINSELIDGTATVLSHELVESITDPTPYGVGDKRSGWIAASSFIEYNAEIGDECQSFTVPTNIFSDHRYTIQLEYSNVYHACVSGP